MNIKGDIEKGFGIMKLNENIYPKDEREFN